MSLSTPAVGLLRSPWLPLVASVVRDGEFSICGWPGISGPRLPMNARSGEPPVDCSAADLGRRTLHWAREESHGCKAVLAGPSLGRRHHVPTDRHGRAERQ